MHSDGAWMIRTPFFRAASNTGAILRASSPHRRVAQAHQCLSHMSQTIMAVSAAGSSLGMATSSHCPLPLKVSTRERRCSLSAVGAGCVTVPLVAPAMAARHSKLGIGGYVLAPHSGQNLE